jgi:hypothetical protein
MANKYKLLQKGYKIDFSKIEEGYLYSHMYCRADSLAKAKSILLKECIGESVCLCGQDDKVTYLTIPVIRCEELDLYDFEGEGTAFWRITEIHEKRKQLEFLDSILNDVTIKYCYIKKGSYYRPNSCGYTEMIHRAGVFTKEEAVSSAKSCSDLKIIPINIKEHNLMLEKEINDLKTRLIL